LISDSLQQPTQAALYLGTAQAEREKACLGLITPSVVAKQELPYTGSSRFFCIPFLPATCFRQESLVRSLRAGSYFPLSRKNTVGIATGSGFLARCSGCLHRAAELLHSL
jgi:hypothetical protein